MNDLIMRLGRPWKRDHWRASGREEGVEIGYTTLVNTGNVVRGIINLGEYGVK